VIAVALLMLLAAPLVSEAQPAERVYRVGFLGGTPRESPAAHLLHTFIESLAALGYVEGRNLVIEGRYSEGRDERLDALAMELVNARVDVIVAGATQPVHAAARATRTIPIVMSNHGDPVGSGLVETLVRPGGNITGLSILNPELSGKRVELLREALPRLSRVAILANPGSQTHARMFEETTMGARSLGVQVRRLPARGQPDYGDAFAAAARERAEAMLVLGDVIFWLDRIRLAELALKQGLPTMFAQREHVDAGGLMSYGPDLRDSYRRAASFVDKILKGAKPGALPIEQPTKFELSVNMKTARSLGLKIPPSLRLRAEHVVE